MKKITPLLDDFLKISACFTIILLIAGYLDLTTHYRFFGVNITQYISASEILLISVDKILIVLLFLGIHLSIWLYFFNYLFTYTNKDVLAGWKPGERRPILEYDSDETIRRFLKKRTLLIFVVSIFTIFFISTVLKFFIPQNKTLAQISIFIFINTWIVLCIYLAGMQPSRFLWRLAKEQKVYHPKFFSSFLLFIPTLLFSTWLNSNFSANHLRRFGNDKKITIKLTNDSIVNSNDTVRYIGRTESYVFFWKQENWNAIIYPSSQIKEINYSK